MKQQDKIKVAVIGGGTGTMAVLSGLKQIPRVDISVIVSMTDDGGSNAVIRDEFGLLPLSDLRKSIIALSESKNNILRSLFVYRFDRGNGLSGHTLGNLMMTALAEITGSETSAIQATGELFRVRGQVIPVTLTHSKLVAEYYNGERVEGEHLIDEPVKFINQHIKKISLSPPAAATPQAIEAILKADYIIAGPGDLYTSTLANIIVGGVADAFKNSLAKFIFINNLMTKKGQTHGMSASDLIKEIHAYAGRQPDVVLLHKGEFAQNILERYKERGEDLILDDIPAKTPYSVIRTDLIGGGEIVKDKGDVLVRSLIRHDSDKLAKALAGLFKRVK